MRQQTVRHRGLQLPAQPPDQVASAEAGIVPLAKDGPGALVQFQAAPAATQALVEFGQFDVEQTGQPVVFEAFEGQDAIDAVEEFRIEVLVQTLFQDTALVLRQ